MDAQWGRMKIEAQAAASCTFNFKFCILVWEKSDTLLSVRDQKLAFKWGSL